MIQGPAALNECKSYARGYLLASHWAETRPPDDIARRLPRLGEDDLGELYDAMVALPEASLAALEKVWVKREKRRRLEDALGLHWTWLAEVLADEPPALLLLALGEIQPEIAKDTFRTLWPKKKPSGRATEVKPLDPSWAGHLRRRLFARFALMGERDRGTDRLGAVLMLDRREFWLLAQDLGRKVLIELARSRNEAELARLLEQMPGAQSARIRRLLQSMRSGDDEDLSESAPAESGEEESESETASPVRLALEDLHTAMDVASTEGELIGLVGLRKLARVLCDRPREYCLSLAQKMAAPVARNLVAWRDDWALAGLEVTEQMRQEILDGLGAALSRGASGSLARGMTG